MSPGVVTMEDVKPLISSSNMQIEDGGALECRFVEICKPEEIERLWFTCILYTVKRLSEGNAKAKQESIHSGFSLCHILRATKLNAVDFLKEMPQFFLKVGHVLRNLCGADWQKRLEGKESQENFVHLRLLSKLNV